ncbi:ecto-NOX disulfide-thiol exchanger 2-like [Trichoplusia ni]|uniref:Ecto-NOX disulfide-thiol exchanger 2-like n=1 Tax=Trichoplusia ni TaxID=7111 RepID=A0A7E5W8F7_TRINI|nr:ecto-NOX disulfide-thiol exchanger 2-like [Trichoplusia ni]
MNSWGNEQYNMQGMMTNIAMPGIMPGMIPPAIIPPFNMVGDMNQIQMQQMGALGTAPQANGQFIGPVVPETQSNETAMAPVDEAANQTQVQEKRQSRDKADRGDRRETRDRDRERESRRRRSRSRNRDSKDRQSNRERHRSDRERTTKWDNNDKVSQQPMMAPNNMMMTGGPMMPYGNMVQNMQTPMMGQHMDMNSMQHMMPGMNMMPNLMMMNQQMQLANQHIYITNGMLLPAIPGTSTPPRRERPLGCRTIFVGGLPMGITEDVVMEIFQRFGDVEEVKLHRQGVCHVRFAKVESVEQSFFVSGWRLKFHDQMESEATTLFIDYALNREDQNEYERNKRRRSPTPPRIEMYNPNNLVAIGEKIKSDTEFAEAAPTLAAWLERGECNKKNSNTFYSLIQASNNQLRRLFNEKMQIDDEYQTLRNSIRDKFGHIIAQFEQVAKILTAAKHQRVSDHFSKQQRRNIEMWLKMTEELENMRDEFNAIFDEEEMEKSGKNMVPMEKYEKLRAENENLTYELEGYKNEAHLAKDDAERKFEKFKAHFIAQQALQNKQQVYPPLPPPPMPNLSLDSINAKTTQPSADVTTTEVNASEAKLISLLSAFLMVHPLGATLDYLVSYVKSLAPSVTQSAVHDVLKKYSDVFRRKTTGVGACIEHKWEFVIFDSIKTE